MRPASVSSSEVSGRAFAPRWRIRVSPIRKSRLPWPSHSEQRSPACRSACRASSSHVGGSCRATSSPIQASKISPASISVSAWLAARSRNFMKAAAVAGESGPRWMSDAIHTRPGRDSLFNDGGFLDDHIFCRDASVEAAAAGLDALALVDDFRSVDPLAEYGIAPAIAGGRGVVQEVVVGNVDEELRGGRVG